jgi:hypothetical protein
VNSHEGDDEHFPEQYSDATREAMIAAVEALVEGLRAHASFLGGLGGGSSEAKALFDAHENVERLLVTWNERVFDHTGTFPVSLFRPDNEDVTLDEETAHDGAPLSVISRWDLSLVDAQALLRAGRQAHQRLNPHENDEDAEAAVPDPAQALYALLHEAGEPWFDLPGVEVVSGARVFIEPDDPVAPPAEDDFDAPIVQPPGRRLYGDSWA